MRCHIDPGFGNISFNDYSTAETVLIEEIGFNEINRAIVSYVNNLSLQKDEGYKIKWLTELQGEVTSAIASITKNTKQ